MKEVELQAYALEIMREYGIPMELVFVSQPKLYAMSWGKIFLSKDILGSAILAKGMFLHEFGHRLISPHDAKTELAIELVAKEEGVKGFQLFRNYICDLVVNNEFPEHKPIFKEFLKQMLRIEEKEEDFKLIYFRNEIHRKVVNPNHKLTAIPMKIWELLNDPRPFLRRVKELAKLLKDFFKQDDYCPSCIGIKPNPKDFEEALKLISEQGIEVGEKTIKAVAKRAGIKPSEVLLVYRRLRLYKENLTFLKEFWGSKVEQLYEIWKLGDDPRELDLTETIQRFGIAVPSITTLKRSIEPGYGRPKEVGSTCVIMDVSGSTQGDTLAREIEAAFCITMNAKRYKHKVSFISFCHKVVDVVRPTYDYDKVIDVMVKQRSGGWTLLSPALEVATSFGRQTTYIFTDAFVFDIQRVVSLLEKLSEQGKLVMFLIGDGNERPELVDEFLRLGKIYFVCRGKHFRAEALKEYQ